MDLKDQQIENIHSSIVLDKSESGERTAKALADLDQGWELAALVQVGQLITSSLKLDEVFRLISKAMLDVIGSERACVLVYNEKHKVQVKAPLGYSKEEAKEPHKTFSKTVLNEAKKTLEPVLIEDTESESVVELGQSICAMELRTVCCAPIMLRGECLGFLYTDKRFSPSARLGEKTRKILYVLSSQAATAIANARQFATIKDLNENLEKKVEERTQELRQTQDQLIQAEKMASLGKLTAGVAHELNNPLNYISGNLEILQTNLSRMLELLDCLAEDRLENIQAVGELVALVAKKKEEIEFDYLRSDMEDILTSVRKGTMRATKIVEDLRTFSRRDDSNAEAFSLSAAVEDALRMMSSKIPQHVVVKKEFENDCQAIGRERQVVQVVLNLISNALDALAKQPEGELTLKTECKDERAWISVSDNGEGMTEEQRSRAFDPFYTTKPVGSGTGLGLSIVHGIIEQHQGSIECFSQKGQGTEFRVALPLVRGDK